METIKKITKIGLSVCFILLIWILFKWAFKDVDSVDINYGISDFPTEQLNHFILNDINKHRISLNLFKLELDDNLQKGAQHHSDYLYSVNLDTLCWIQDNVIALKLWPKQQSKIELIRGHEENIFSSDVIQQSFNTRSNIYSIAKENVMTIFGTIEAIDTIYAKTIVETWKKSPPHYQTMIDPNMKYCGIASKIFKIQEQTFTTITKNENPKTRKFEVTSSIDNTMCNIYIVTTMTFK